MIKLIYPTGATLLDADEAEGLVPKHIATQNELDEWEFNNIVMAETWAFDQKHFDFTLEFVKTVHFKMFNQTWKWAGSFRKTNKNIGVDYSLISQRLKILIDDVEYQIKNDTYSFDEIAYRFHHRLVAIHPFPNGNGRHARLMTDILLVYLNQNKFTWGEKSLSKNIVRDKYIKALQKADKHDYKALAEFVRS